MTLLRPALFALLALLLAGCASPKPPPPKPAVAAKPAPPPKPKLDMAKLRDALTQAARTLVGADPDSVECPESVVVEVGHRFDCTVSVAGTSFAYEVSITDSAGNVKWVTKEGVLSAHKLEAVLAADVEKQTGSAPKSVDCGERIRRSVPDTTFSCDATTANDKPLTYKIRIKDENGGVEITAPGT